MSEFYLVTKTGHSICYRAMYSSDSNAPTLIFLSGLADDVSVWKMVIRNLKNQKMNIVLVNLIGQGSALERDFERGVEHFLVSIEDQSQALSLVFDQLGLSKPVHLIGFSYGGAVALEFQHQNPALVKALHLWLPFVKRLDLTSPIMQLWKSNIESLFKLNPLTSFWIDKWNTGYQEWLYHYMHFRFSKRLPDYKLRQVAVEMSQGSLNFDGFSVLRKLKGCRVHLVISHMDTLVPLTLYNEIWRSIPFGSKGFCLRVRDGEHLLHEQSPQLLAHWLEHCLGHHHLFGSEFDGWAASSEINTPV